MNNKTPDILKKILHRKEEEIAERSAKGSIDVLREKAVDASPVRGFIKAIENKIAQGKSAVIAEIGRAHV